MKLRFSLVLIALLLTASLSALAQAPPPPDMAPDYAPKLWKEYSFADDNVRFRFPAPPERVVGTTGAAKRPSRTYTRESFMYLDLTVIDFTGDLGKVVDKKALLDGGVKGMLDGIKKLDPKILVEEDVSVDGSPGRFLKIDTKSGLLLRVKFFSVDNKLYIAQAIVKKGERHGTNWEDDFEIPTMAFLDSLHLIAKKQNP
jgi:hypothetical protein